MAKFFFKPFFEAVKLWYVPLLVGLFFVGLGIVAFTWPLGSYAVLAMVFSFSFLLSGISEIIFSVANKNNMENWGWYLAFGIITFILGFLLLADPGASMTVLAFYIGFTILFRSISSISFAMDVKRHGSRQWGWLLVLGILGALFSIILLVNPLLAGMTVTFWIGFMLLFSGLFSIYFSFQLKKLHRHTKNISAELKDRWIVLQKEIHDSCR
ncbi:HdeD family acid-resistance protein [Saccharicrinis carchari]|nr:HdeD family acid-resistance protein [Saccharicrinis carchari]